MLIEFSAPVFSALLSLMMVGLTIYCWQRRYLTGAVQLAGLCLCLALAFFFNVHRLLAFQNPDTTQAQAKLLFWGGWRKIVFSASILFSLWLALTLKPAPWPIIWQRLLSAGLVILLLVFAYLRLARKEGLILDSQYDAGHRLLTFQLTAWGQIWVGLIGLIQLVAVGWLLASALQSRSPTQRRQAGWLLLPLSIPLLQLGLHFLPTQARAVAFLYFSPWLMAAMPFLIGLILFHTGLLAHLPYYQSIAFQRMPAAGLILDSQQRILAFNPVAEQVFKTEQDQVEGKVLSVVFPFLSDLTTSVMIDGEAYSHEITELQNRQGQSSGQLIQLNPLPSEESVQQLYNDLELKLDQLRYHSDDGSSYSWNDYLGNLIFKVTMVGYLTAEHVQAEIDIVNLKLAAVLEHYPDRQLHAIIDTRYSHGINRSVRENTIQQWIEWGQHPCFGQMAIIQNGGFIKAMLGAVQRLAPHLKISTHPSEEEALAYIHQQQRQSVDKSKFLQWWQEAQETMPVGDQSLKVVRRPQWQVESTRWSCQQDLIEGEVIFETFSGQLDLETLDASLEITDQIEAQLGYPVQYLIMAGERVTGTTASSIRQAAESAETRSPRTRFVIPPVRYRGVARLYSSLLLSFRQSKAHIADSMEQALQQIYGTVAVVPEVPLSKLGKADLIDRVNQLRQQINQYRQETDTLTQQLGRMLWLNEEQDSSSNDYDPDLDSVSPLADLVSVIEAVQSDLKELLTERDRHQQELEQKVEQRTKQLNRALEEAQLAQTRAEEARGEAEQASQAKSRFLSRMGHEIRTPMNGIIGSLTLLNPRQLAPIQRQDVERALSSADHLLGVINEILDFSRLEAGQMTYSTQPFDLSSACRQVVDQLSSLARSKDLYLQLQLSPDLWATREGDQQKVRQILISLIGNAIKFTRRGGVTVSVTALDTERVHFEVIDTGIGIAEDQRERLFEAFSQAEEGTTRRYSGTGLGLAISRELVTTMGGQIGVESQLEVGSTFWFELPLQPVEVELAAESLPVETSAETDFSGLRVLVVDDDKVNRVVVTHHLEQMGCQIEEAANGQKAIDIFRPDRYDLILMDLHMPRMNGYEASRQIRLAEQAVGNVARIPIVALTASESEEAKERCWQVGMDGYLSKPFQVDNLIAEIERLRPDFQPVEERQTLVDQVLTTELESVSLFEPDNLIDIGDPDFLREMVDLAIETTELRLSELRAAIEAEDWLQTGEVSHQLKGALGTCGAKRMSAIATKMKEQAGRDRPNQVVETYRESVEIWRETQLAMQDYLETLTY